MQKIEYIMKLLKIPSPTGFCDEIMDYIFKETLSLNYQPIKTNKGAVIVKVNGQDDQRQRLITAHLDTLGAMVKEIKANGRLKLALIGGFTYSSIENENCIIHALNGQKKIEGTILLHQSSVHTYSDAKTASRDQNNMEVRIDAKVFNSDDVRKLGIEVGDFISFDSRSILTDSGFIKSRHLDDKISAGLMLALLSKIQKEEIKLPHTTYFYFSNNEEIGYGGNSNIPKEVVEYLAVDMGALGDGQNSDEYTVSICAKDSSGPYHLGLRNHLVNLAKTHQIPYKLDIYSFYGSDASAAINAGYDIKHGLIGAGVESSHAYERSHLDSINACYELLNCYLLSDMID